MSTMSDVQILITENGPYLVSGAVPLSEQTITVDAQGNTWDFADTDTQPGGAGERYALCRCGQSARKPFCDGTHTKVGFDGTETASRRSFEEDAGHTDGPGLHLDDNRALCAFARICDGHGRIWTTVHDTDDPEKRAIVEHQASHCPSGRLVVTRHGGGEPIELNLDPSIVLLEDPQENASGPIWARGGITITSADGFTYEIRNRVTLCRCGQSKNKPFCNGTHAHVGFRAHA
jgi:CDGSH-type Zn-finger protein